MCFFPSPNFNVSCLAYQKGITEFDCGVCPECLQKRSSSWALRSVYEAKDHAYNCMITLTYDNFARDSSGNLLYGSNGLPIELPVDPSLCVDKRHIQLFIKRLRKWYSSFSSHKIKYLCCAEYGSRTHRAHYHLILFGVKFPDLHFYKKSKRGNPIYMSPTLTRLWSKGICTVDSIKVHSAIARYCTKYVAKSRSSGTFMLASQNIGIESLLRSFNGKSYFIEGREHPVPRGVWQQYIMRKYPRFRMDYRYVNHTPVNLLSFSRCRQYSDGFGSKYTYARVLRDRDYERGARLRARYRSVRDSDPVYSAYLEYWHSKSLQFESLKLSAISRLRLLPESKYANYKNAALQCIADSSIIPYPAPGSNCVSRYYHFLDGLEHNLGFRYSLAPCSRLNRASDTKPDEFEKKFLFNHYGKRYFYKFRLHRCDFVPPDFVHVAQISLFD